jgi:hypothetical protein
MLSGTYDSRRARVLCGRSIASRVVIRTRYDAGSATVGTISSVSAERPKTR